MNLEKLTIGQMASLNRISTQTLRYYDKKKLLQPYFIDEENGYRYYHINQCARLDMIQHLKSTGASLEEIKSILDDNIDSNSLIKLLENRLVSIENEINRANQKKATITKFIQNYKKYEKMYFEESIFLEYLPTRLIYSYTTKFNYFENGSKDYEMMMRELKSLFYKEHLPLCYFCNVGTIVKEKDIKEHKLISNDVFVFIENDINVPTKKLNENWYVCICSDNFEKEAKLAERLIHYIDSHNYKIIGDYLCEVILDFPDFKEKPRKLFYKLQIPVNKC